MTTTTAPQLTARKVSAVLRAAGLTARSRTGRQLEIDGQLVTVTVEVIVNGSEAGVTDADRLGRLAAAALLQAGYEATRSGQVLTVLAPEPAEDVEDDEPVIVRAGQAAPLAEREAPLQTLAPLAPVVPVSHPQCPVCHQMGAQCWEAKTDEGGGYGLRAEWHPERVALLTTPAEVEAPEAPVEQPATDREVWAARFDRAEWVAPFDTSGGMKAGESVLGWVCPSCAKVEVNEYLLDVNHGYDPSIPGRAPFEGWGSPCSSMRLRASQEAAAAAKAAAELEPKCESCGHRAGLHYAPEHVRADRLTCRAFTCHCTHRPGQALEAPKPARVARPARASKPAPTTPAAPAQAGDREFRDGRVFASKLRTGERVALRDGEAVIDRVVSEAPRKVRVHLADGSSRVMGSWAWVRLVA